jgi:hypothetical protein
MYSVVVQNYKRELNETYTRELKNFEVIEDIGYGAIPTFLKCLCNDENDLLYLEDDVILCKDFENELEKVFSELGKDNLIQLFSLKKVITKTTLMNGSTYCGNVGFFIPKEMRLELVKYFNEVWSKSQCYKDNPTAMDYLVRDFLKDNKYKYWLVVPNLIQHQEGKSVIDPRRSSKRQSLYFKG